MYNRKDWGGLISPYIDIKFVDPPKKENMAKQISMIIFEWGDRGLIGKTVENDKGVSEV